MHELDAITAADELDEIEEARAKARLDPWGDNGLDMHARMAARFVTIAKDRCIFVHGAGWHRYDGKRWAPDMHETHAYKLLNGLLAKSWAEARHDQTLERVVKACSTARGMDGVLEIASRQLFAAVVDDDPYLLNCKNGTLDLRTLTMRQHDPADLITKVTRANYEATALGTEWNTFLASSLPNQDVLEFLQRVLGMSLIGKVLEHVLVILTGTGRNGKGITTRTVSKALGEYAITGSNTMLIASKYGQQSAGEQASRMRLRGSRLVIMAELEKGSKLAPATMKSLTGGDTIEAKYMGQNPVQFQPSHSILMETNYLPTVDAEDAAVWARLRVVPFDVSFAGREDNGLEERLEAELDAVLAWVVQGLWDYWHMGGLRPPDAVLKRTGEYRTDNDPFQQFITEMCITHRDARVSRKELHHSYVLWVRDNGADSMTNREFTPRIRAIQGVKEGKSNGADLWKGIGLKSDDSLFD